MVNNFYIGKIIHKNFFNRKKYEEKMILYSVDCLLFIDLLNQKEYVANEKDKNYIDLDSLINININDFKDDYIYLLSRYKNKKKLKYRKGFKN